MSLNSPAGREEHGTLVYWMSEVSYILLGIWDSQDIESAASLGSTSLGSFLPLCLLLTSLNVRDSERNTCLPKSSPSY